jgi:hypothetical protein
MHDHREEATMNRRLPASPLILLTLVVAIMLPVIPAASADPDRMDWAVRVAEMDEALKRADAPAVQFAWREAYVAAHVSRGWPGMLAVGDAAIRAGAVTGPQIAEARARRAYLTALLRARRHNSLDGVLAAGEAFGRLGDVAVVQMVAKVASDLVERSGDGVARDRVQAFRAQWAPRT